MCIGSLNAMDLQVQGSYMCYKAKQTIVVKDTQHSNLEMVKCLFHADFGHDTKCCMKYKNYWGLVCSLL